MPDDAALFDIAALRAIEANAARLLGDDYELMRRAGHAAWRVLLQQWPQAQRLLVVCGPGNNGGDGYELARHAQQSGRAVTVMRLREHAPRSELAQRACSAYQAAGGRVRLFEGALDASGLDPCDLVVDAVFGIGFSHCPDAGAVELLAAINAQTAPVFALDAPSGVDADRGSCPGIAVTAALTLEFIAAKTGLRTGAALDHVGTRELATLDLPAAAFDGVVAKAECLQAIDLARWLRPRARDSHKGANGRVLCVGGDHGSGGAIVLCAQAALRSGAGWVEVATREDHVPALLARLPEAMSHAVETAAAASPWLARADVIALGPGLGQGDWGHELLVSALTAGKPLLLDADALNLLAAHPRALSPDTILTPHPGEAARLLGVDVAAVQRDRFAAARALVVRYACVVVLKGAGSIVCAPNRPAQLIDAGNPGMAVAGMGDVLSGVIAALWAQGLDAFDAARCGALLHAVAGDDAARDGGQRGLQPSDLMPCLRRLANPPPTPREAVP